MQQQFLINQREELLYFNTQPIAKRNAPTDVGALSPKTICKQTRDLRLFTLALSARELSFK